MDFESAQGRADAAQLRLNKRLHETNDALYEMRDAGKAAILDLIDSIGSGEDALGAFANAFAGLGRQMAASGLDKIMDALLGGSTAGGRTAANDNRSGGGIVGAIVAAVTGNVPIPTSRPSNSNIPVPTPSPGYQSPSYPYADKYSVPALTKATASLDAAAKAIRTIESGSAAGNYSALGPITRTGDRAYGAYQVMGANIPQWSKQAIGRVVSNVEFLGSKEIQDAVFKSRFGDNYAAKYGLVGASQAWFAGEGGMRNLGAKDVVGTSVSAYGSKFSSLLDKHSGTDTNDQKIVAKGVSQGLEDYQRKLGPENHAAGRFDPGGASSATGGLFGPRGQAGMQVLGAGLGAFGAGYQSGSPVSGGITGALGGYQAGGAISTALNIGPMAGGVLGVVGGAALGILGGILGARKQREQAHRDKAAKWEELRPQYEAFDKSLSGDGNGQLRQWITTQKGQLDQYMKVGGDAWKYGSGNSSAQFASTGTKMYTRFMEMMEEYREGFTDMVEDLTSGEGLGGAFAKGRAATKDLKKQIKDMIDDVSIAFNSNDIGVPTSAEWDAVSKGWEEQRNKAIADAKKAAGEYSLSLLYTAETTSDVEKSLDGFRGTAAGLQKVLTDLGWTAEAAATDIDDRLKQAIAKMGETFTDGFQAQINDLSGLSYLNDAKDLLKARDTAMNDAKLLGVDPEIVSRWFKLASQDLVDGSELVGSAFDDLIKAFPELSGVVHAFTGATRTQAEAARAAQQAYSTAYEAARSQIQSVYQTVLSFRDGLRSYQDQLKVSDSSTLSQADQVREAQRIYDETLAKANAGDKEAMNGLTGAAGDLLSKAKDYFKSSPEYVAIFESVSASLKAAEGKATDQLSAMERSASWLKDIAGSNLDIAKAVADLGASLKNLNGSRQWGAMADQNKAIWKDLQSQGIDYTGNFGGGQFLDWVKTQLPSQQAVINAIVAKWSAVYAPKAAMRFGGIVGAYAGGGVVGNGIWDRDSVLARYAGGGEIALAGGEGVINASAMNKPGVASMVARLNRGVPDPYPRTEMLRQQAANVNAEGSFASRGDMREVTARLDRIVDTLSEGFGGSIEATNRLSSNAQQSAYAARRAAIKAGKAA
ncbi:hypothetical protein ACLNGM_10100 [Aureimonas phyllosphaerae]|uniref:hypothetical protein n=1 Tax=Aureimonas phyllosphaerae TaxID=1166078 RepID=UPI003A5C1612